MVCFLKVLIFVISLLPSPACSFAVLVKTGIKTEVSSDAFFAHHPLARNVASNNLDNERYVPPSPPVSLVDPSSIRIYLIPLFAALSGFNLYEITTKTFHATVEFLSHNTWIPVDGGALLADIMLPAINGPVMTSISILLGTLTAITISSLYDRQNRIGASVNAELEELRNLAIFSRALPDPHRQAASMHLRRHVEQMAADALNKTEVTPQSLRMRPHLEQLLVLLNELSAQAMNSDAHAASPPVSDNILGGCYSSISKINSERSSRVSSLQATFPPLHYVTLGVLASAVTLVFLVETDRNVLFFLAAFQLKGLWALLWGIFSLLAVLIYDLATPFVGTYNIIGGTQEDVLHIKEYLSEPLMVDSPLNDV